MKKLVAMLLAGAMVFSMAACGSNGNDNASDGTKGTDSQKEEGNSEAASKRPPREKKLKLSYKEEREAAVIDDEIAALEEKVADLDAQILANATNAGRLNELTRQKEEAGAQLEEKLDRWVYLNDLAERIERGELVEQ